MQQKRYPRKVRVAELLRQALCDHLARNDDLPFLTLHHVDVANDYSLAKIYYSLLDETPEKLEETSAHFSVNANEIRRKIAAKLQLRSTPKLEFHYASDLRKAEEISYAIERISKNPPK